MASGPHKSNTKQTPTRRRMSDRPVLKQIHARPRLIACVVLGILAWVLFPETWRMATRILLAWNMSVWLYLALAAYMIRQSSHETIKARAESQDEGRNVILVMTCIAAIASIAAIVAQLAATKDMTGLNKAVHIALAGSTILSAFAFIHLEFALHYAHEYVMEDESDAKCEAGERGGLNFPGTDRPDYLDFLYFSFVIGVAAQTADIAICSQRMRRVALMHCILAFFFNTTVLALTINIAAGLI